MTALKSYPIRLATLAMWLFLAVTVCAQSNEQLIVSNYPEEITEPGMIMNDKLNNPYTRLIYYHKNSAPNDLYLALVLQNTSSKAIKVALEKGMGGPDLDGLFAGHIATRQYFNDVINHHSETITLKPYETQKILTQKIKPRHISTGVVSLQIPSENRGEVAMKLVAVDGIYSQLSPLNESLKSPFQVVKYDKAEIYQTVFYEVGNPIQEIPVGVQPKIVDARNGIFLKGNYGLMYHFDIVLKNPFAAPRTVNIYFSSTGGMARGNFIVNQAEVTQTGFLSHRSDFKPERISSITLKPFETRSLSIMTMPQAGSYYPVQLVLQSEV